MKKKDYVALALFIRGLSMKFGDTSTYREQQIFCEETFKAFNLKQKSISRERLRQTEAMALRKCRIKLRSRPELMAELEQRQQK